MGTICRLVTREISTAVASSGSLRRAQMATSTPSLANAKVIALPMPSLAPVTSAFFPVIRKSMAASPLLRAKGKLQQARPAESTCKIGRGGALDRQAIAVHTLGMTLPRDRLPH